MIKSKLLIALLLSALHISSYAAEVDIPNSFSAGTPAVAADVNANFTAVETAVDGNAVDIVGLRTGDVRHPLQDARRIETRQPCIRAAASPRGDVGSGQHADAGSPPDSGPCRAPRRHFAREAQVARAVL